MPRVGCPDAGRRGQLDPVVGDGRGVTSFVHVDDAAAATVLALGESAGRVGRAGTVGSLNG